MYDNAVKPVLDEYHTLELCGGAYVVHVGSEGRTLSCPSPTMQIPLFRDLHHYTFQPWQHIALFRLFIV